MLIVFLVVAFLALFTNASAELSVAETANSNLTGAQPTQQFGATQTSLLTDGILAGEGDHWNCALASILADSSSLVLYDLGQSQFVTAIDIQADNNDEYVVEISQDALTFEPLWTAQPVPGDGLRRRTVNDLNAWGRYIRVRARGGDGHFSIAEFSLYESLPDPWPQKLEVKRPTPAWRKRLISQRDHTYRIVLAAFGLLLFVNIFKNTHGRRSIPLTVPHAVVMSGITAYRFLSDKVVPVWVAVVILTGLVGWIAIGALRLRQGQTSWSGWERGALVCVIVVSASAWTNFGHFHGLRVVHYWDMFHYYVGAKYFEENQYDRLYEAALVADYQMFGEEELTGRRLRDLRDNRLHHVTKRDVLEFQARCKDHFTEDRWRAFSQDAQSFRAMMGVSWWREMLTDHGYNATPVANLLAVPITNLGWQGSLAPDEGDGVGMPATLKFRQRILTFALIDMAIYALSFAAIAWAFGLRACAFAMLIWGTGYPWAYFWTGGGYARVSWLFLAITSVCLRKRGYPLLSGFALSWSALLRLFPLVLAGGPLARIGDRLLRRRREGGPWFEAAEKRFVLGGALGVVLLVGLSLAASGPALHVKFLENTFKHEGTALTNHMGMPTVLSFRPGSVGRFTWDSSLDDPWGVWKEKRAMSRHELRWLHAILVLCGFVLLARVSRNLSGWATISVSTVLIVLVFELTCYYYIFVVLLAPLALERRRYVVAMMSMVLAGQALQFGFGWFDEQYVWETVVIFLTMIYIMGDLVRTPLPSSSIAGADQDRKKSP